MNPDLGSLDRLRDIVEPPPVSWWPPAFGWWIVGALVLIALTAMAAQWARQWIRNRYRRRAQQLLASAETVTDVTEILKRTALTVYPREEVASLSGTTWCEWLGQTGGRDVPTTVEQALRAGGYRDEASTDMVALRAFAQEWITKHRVPHPETH